MLNPPVRLALMVPYFVQRAVDPFTVPMRPVVGQMPAIAARHLVARRGAAVMLVATDAARRVGRRQVGRRGGHPHHGAVNSARTNAVPIGPQYQSRDSFMGGTSRQTRNDRAALRSLHIISQVMEVVPRQPLVSQPFVIGKAARKRQKASDDLGIEDDIGAGDRIAGHAPTLRLFRPRCHHHVVCIAHRRHGVAPIGKLPSHHERGKQEQVKHG